MTPFNRGRVCARPGTEASTIRRMATAAMQDERTGRSYFLDRASAVG
jgi:hypothetical protein